MHVFGSKLGYLKRTHTALISIILEQFEVEDRTADDLISGQPALPPDPTVMSPALVMYSIYFGKVKDIPASTRACDCPQQLMCCDFCPCTSFFWNIEEELIEPGVTTIIIDKLRALGVAADRDVSCVRSTHNPTLASHSQTMYACICLKAADDFADAGCLFLCKSACFPN